VHSCVVSVELFVSMSPASRVCDAVQRLLYSVCQCVLSCVFGAASRKYSIEYTGWFFYRPSEYSSFIASLGLRMTAATLRTVVKRVALAA